MTWIDRAYLACAIMLAASAWFAYDRLGQAEARAAAYAEAYTQWREYGERERQTALAWAAAAEHNAREAERAMGWLAGANAERELLAERVLHAEARTPFSLEFLRWADGVTGCESSDNPRAVNGRQVGLLQIDVPSHEARIARLGYTPADLLRPIPNLVVAESIWREQGARPWPHCGRGR